jgi:undecaprenyl-diphosphatase
MEQILEWDKQLLLWLNSFHLPWLDPVMRLLTETMVWIPFYIFLAYLIFKNYKKEGWFILIGVAIALFLADQTANFMKFYFARLRPSNELKLQDLVHVVGNYRGGKYGFASGHAANTFAVAFLLWLVLKKYYRWAVLIFLWAIFMCYTRIYLGVHYPGDIIVGALLGILCGGVSFLIYRTLYTRWDRYKMINSK